MTRRLGAYARQLGPDIVVDIPPLEPTEVGPGWRTWVQMSTGLRYTPCGPNAGHAYAVNRLARVIAEQGVPQVGEGVPVGGVVLDPEGSRHDEWGFHVDPDRSRWRFITRVTQWMRCQGCDAVLWPGRMVTVKMAAHLVRDDVPNDIVCARCQQGREQDDPRPMWPADAPEPPMSAWPDWLREDKRKPVPLPKGYRFLGQPRRRR